MVNYNDENLNDVFQALSDPTRREIIRSLAASEMTVMNLAKPFDMSLPAISKHLKVMEKAGLVSVRKEGTYRYYYLNPQAIENAQEWLVDLRKFWTAQVFNLEQFLETQSKED
ncbi:ArsR family transcriptional regulator [Paenibacillus sp. 1011MAR3C5]|uniref:ArsR/SmtB family transcription factor n=1 Tax=Paenibacillus sp. 1011MAR3C5 TaxID=1675787 RepID=UPI000E6D1BB4|nr:metalloregulator ArsR/SmtB family transcription factor [Paenibacillus sp. 1011MAR3C5]RJE84748.1 ArsR family transcriptional regulator [Paenibacillus sp. 1011MAR3C5]